jgi:ubiquinone/menaquinone biosynthesis C-methylase UbiE
MSEITILSQIAKIRAFEKGHRAAQVLNTGFRFGLLSALAEAPEGLRTAELAVKLMLFEPFLKIWCQTAYHFEILDCNQQGRFSLQPYLEEALGLDMSLSCQPEEELPPGGRSDGAADPLSEYIRSGRPVLSRGSPLSSFAVCRATKSISTIFLSMIFPEYGHLKKKLEEGCAFLDVGCGSGSLILDLAGIFKKSTFTGIDPDVYGIDKAEAAVIDLGLEGRVSVENLAAEEIGFQETFDLAGMVLTLHEVRPDVRPEALKKICRALKKGGRLLILDYPYPGRLEDFRNPRYEYGIIEQYFEAMTGIVHLAEKEQDELLYQAGFTEVERRPVGEGGLLDFVLAGK